MSEALAVSLPALSELIEPDAVVIEDLALDYLLEHRIVQKALPPFLARVLSDPDLREQMLCRLIEGECRRMLDGQIAAKHREEKKTGGGPLGKVRNANMRAWAGAVESALLDGFKLPDGTKLGDATRSDLTAAMASYQITATDATIKHRWLQLVQQGVQPGATVRQCLSEERVAELKELAKRGDA